MNAQGTVSGVGCGRHYLPSIAVVGHVHHEPIIAQLGGFEAVLKWRFHGSHLQHLNIGRLREGHFDGSVGHGQRYIENPGLVKNVPGRLLITRSAVAKVPRPARHPVVARVKKLNRIANADCLPGSGESRLTQNRVLINAGFFQIFSSPELVALRRAAVHRRTHAQPLPFREHAAAVGIVHIVLDVVQ